MKPEPITGQTFAQTTAVIARCKRVTYEVAGLNENGWRQNDQQEFFWRLVVAVRIDTMAVSDRELARAMLESAKAVIEDRLAGLEPQDGVVTPKVVYTGFHEGEARPRDLRTREGRAWRAAQRAVTV